MTLLTVNRDNEFEYAGDAGQLHEEFAKAITVGYPPGAPGTNGVNVIEDLSATQTILTTTDKDLKLMKMLPKEPCENTVAQYVVQTSYGDPNQDLFQAEIDTPTGSQADYNRRLEYVKFMSRKGQVSFAAQLTKSIVDPMTQETNNAARQLLEFAERACFNGDTALSPLQFNGLKKRILTESPITNVIDLKGAAPTSFDLDKAIAIGSDKPNNASFTHFFLPPKSKQAFNRSYNSLLRADTNVGGTLSLNIDFENYISSEGGVLVESSKFIDDAYNGSIPASQSGNVPGTPIVTVAPAAGTPAVGVTSSFYPTDAGTYLYYAQARNKAGVSQAVALNATPLSVAQNQAITFTLTDSSPAGQYAQYFHIFRTNPNGVAGTQQEIARVPNIVTNSGAQAVPVTDVNFKRPGTSYAYLLQMDAQAMSWMQFLPLVKKDLALTQTSYDFMMLLFGTMAFKSPGRFIMFCNVGY